MNVWKTKLGSGRKIRVELVLVFLVLILVPFLSIGAEEDSRLKAALEELPDKPPALDFILSDADGKSHTLSDYRGKVVFVHFWSVYCPTCRREVSAIDQFWELYNELKKRGETDIDAEYLAINFGEDKEKIAEWHDSLDRTTHPAGAFPNFHVLLDPDKAVTKAWKIHGLPTTYLLDTQGRMLAYAVGERDWTTPEILQQMRTLISE